MLKVGDVLDILSIPLLAADETLRLTPNTRLSGTAFSLRDDEVAVAASLSLSLSHSDLPGDSQLGVLLNGETLQTIDLDQFNAGGMTQRLDIPSALILPFNRLEFRLLGQATQQCHGDDQSVGRVEIAPESRLALTLQRLPFPARTRLRLGNPCNPLPESHLAHRERPNFIPRSQKSREENSSCSST